MTLLDYVRDQSRETQDAIANVDKAIERLELEKRDSDLAARRARDEANTKRAIIDERKRTLGEATRRVQDLEGQIRALQVRLNERIDEERLARVSVQTVEQELGELHRANQDKLAIAKAGDEKITKCQAEKLRHRQRLMEARRSALTSYISDLWSRLIAVDESQEALGEKLLALQAMRKARHEVPKVAGLAEAREEWLRIVSSAVIPSVKNTARSELQKIEDELARLFPGALEVERRAPGRAEIEELFYSQLDGEREAWLILPIPGAIYLELETGGVEREHDLAMRLLWALTRAVPFAGAAGFELRHGRTVLRTSRDEVELSDALELQLGNECSVSFIVSPLPSEVQEALRDEDTHQ